MVKLASARECRQYGPSHSKKAWEYVNASLYVVATILLLVGFVLQFPDHNGKVGLILVLIALATIVAVNLHDLFAHLAGINYRLPLINLDRQFGLVEVASPLAQAIGAILFFVGILILLLQEVRRGFDSKLERYALDLLIAGPAFWVLGSIHNAFQVYERADAQVQALQKSVYLPFLIGSILYLLGSIFNRERPSSWSSRLRMTSIWLAIVGSIMLVIGGLFNLWKVHKVQQMESQLEKLRGGAQERLVRDREGRLPLLLEEHMRKRQSDSQVDVVNPPQPYKDVLVKS